MQTISFKKREITNKQSYVQSHSASKIGNQNILQLYIYQRLICLKTLCANKGKRKQNFTHYLVGVQIGTMSLKVNMKISTKVSA